MKSMFGIQNMDPESEFRTQICSPVDGESFDTDYNVIPPIVLPLL